MADFLTYAEIQTAVQDLLDDDDATVLTVLQAAINRVYHDIIARFKRGNLPARWLVDYDDALSTAVSTRTNILTAGNNVERILAMSVDNQPCTPIDWQELEGGAKARPGNPSPDYYWDTSNKSRPTRFYHKKAYTSAGVESNTIYWFLLPDAIYSFRYWYEKRVTLLTGANVPILPPFAHPALIYGTLAQAALFDIRAKSGPWDVMYEGLINDLESFNANFVFGSNVAEPFGL